MEGENHKTVEQDQQPKQHPNGSNNESSAGADQVRFMKEPVADDSPETENRRFDVSVPMDVGWKEALIVKRDGSYYSSYASFFSKTLKAMFDKFFNERQKGSNKAALDDLPTQRLELGEHFKRNIYEIIDVYPKKEIYELSTPQGSNKSIFRVHKELQKQSPTSYTPQLLSIGPYHHGNPMYASMEEQKKSYRHRFFQRNMTSEEKALLNFLDWESKARGCYSERVEMNSYEFRKMLLNDGAFSIEYMLTVCAADGELRFGRTMSISHIQRDMILLENQLPYFVLKDLWNSIPEYKRGRFHSLEHLVATFFNIYRYNATNFIPTVSQDPAHLVDLLRLLMVPDHQLPMQAPLDMDTNAGFMDEVIIMSAQELENSGISIQVSKNPHLTDITFRPWMESLMIPRLTLDNTSEILFRNIIAFEQYHSKFKTHKRYISDYMILMDGLLKQDSEKLLVRNGILVNNLIDDRSGMNLVKELCQDITFSNQESFHYAPLCRDLKKHSSSVLGELNEWLTSKLPGFKRVEVFLFALLIFGFAIGNISRLRIPY